MSEQTFIPPEEAVDVDRRRAERWIAEHPVDALLLFFALAVLLHVPVIGWVLRKLLQHL